MPGEGRVMQSTPLVAFAIDQRAMQHEPACRFALAFPGGEHERLFVEAVLEIHIGAVLDEQLHHRNVAAPRGDHKARADVLAFEIWIEPAREPAADSREIALLDAHAKG